MNAVALRQQALAATSALRSYAFTTTETLAGGITPTVTTIEGRAVRPDSITFTVTGTTNEQATRIGTRSYVKLGNGPWRPGRAVRMANDPLKVLLNLLRIGNPAAADTHHIQLILQPIQAETIHLINVKATGELVVVAELDSSHHVVKLTVRVPLHAKTRKLMLTAVTDYTGFDAQRAITAPR